MKRFLFWPVICLISAISLHGQKTLPAFGQPIREELEMKTCSFDPSANAMKLLDYQEKELIIDFGFKMKTTRRVKIKIFNPRGFEHASISIPYISRIKGTKLSDMNAYIHYQDEKGNIITEKVDKNQIFRNNQNNAFKKISFTFPNLKAGAVIEYQYELTEKNSLYLDPWFFQDIIPTQLSLFKLTIPYNIRVENRLMGVDSIIVNTKEEGGGAFYAPSLVREYSLLHVPAFKPEKMMTSVADNLQRVEFAVQSNLPEEVLLKGESRWKRYARILMNAADFGKQISKLIPGTEPLIDTAKKMKSRDEKINYLYQQIRKQVKWDEMQTFYPGNLADAWKEKSGNSADINLLLLNLLQQSGIPGYPVLASTRDNGRADENFYSFSQFNAVDILIKDSSKTYLLDGTQQYQSWQIPPANILNRYAFSLDTANAHWFLVSDSRPLLKTILYINSSLTEDGRIVGSANTSYFDHSKQQRILENDKTKGGEKAEEREFIKKDFTELKIDSLVVADKEDEMAPLSESFVFTHEPSSSGDFIFLDPFFLTSFRKNPFTDSARRFSIDFNSRQYLLTSMSITLPPNYQVDFQTKNVKLRMADSSIIFTRTIRIVNNTIYFTNITEVLEPLFDPEQYPAIRDFFNRMYAMVAEQIILKKK